MDIDTILAELCPAPTPEDSEDLTAIAMAFARLVARRNKKLETELAHARGHLAKLIDANAVAA